MKKLIVIGGVTATSNIAQALAKLGHQVAYANPWSSEADGSVVEGVVDGVVVEGAIDLSDRSSVFRFFENSEKVLGGLDGVIYAPANDAAVQALGCHDKETDAEWSHRISHLLNGGFYSTQAALRKMCKQGAGRFVFVCADNAVDGSVGQPGLSAASCGLLALASTVAASTFSRGVTMNSILVGSPYQVSGDMPVMPEPSTEQILPYTPSAAVPVMRARALHRLDDGGVSWQNGVASLLDYLCSDGAGLISGASLRVSNVGEHITNLRWSY